MANRRTPVSVVDAVLPAADLAVSNVTIRDLSVQTATPEGILQWLARHGLVPLEIRRVVSSTNFWPYCSMKVNPNLWP